MNLDTRTISINDEDIVRLRFMNLSGNPDRFNNTSRGFTIVLTEAKAHELEQRGLDVRWRDFPDGSREPTLKVKANYSGKFPPKIYKRTSKNTVLLSEDTVGTLDYDEIVHAEIDLSPWSWEQPGGRHGVSAYIKSARFTIAEDRFASDSEFDELG